MIIKIRSLTGKDMEMAVEESDTILKLKQRIEEKEGINPDQQRLISSGRAMADIQTIGHYQLKPGCTVHLVLAL